jgi:hypothetical protein
MFNPSKPNQPIIGTALNTGKLSSLVVYSMHLTEEKF